ncbi:MAG: hypothetical protein EBZ77_11005 [Chitinophagia bacterium]|nr:hypothetical protein [Chitinophagia bacterium]
MRYLHIFLLFCCLLLAACTGNHTYFREKGYSLQWPPTTREVPPHRWQADYYTKNINNLPGVQLPINAMGQDRAASLVFAWVVGNESNQLTSKLEQRYPHSYATSDALSRNLLAINSDGKVLGFKIYPLPTGNTYMMYIQGTDSAAVQQLLHFSYIVPFP